MTRSVSTSIALFCALSILASFASIGCGGPQANTNGNTNTALMSPAPSATVDCTTATPEQIISAVYDALSKDKIFGPQEWQFNITASAKVITIIGWSADRDAIKDLVTRTALGCSFSTDINTTFVTSRGALVDNYRIIFACPHGYAPCGDICIPENDFCKVNAGPAHASGYTCALSGTPGPSPSASPTATVKKAN